MLVRVIWVPIVITALAIVGHLYMWPLEILAPVLFVLLVIAGIVAFQYDREKRLDNSLLRIKELGAYFVHRFAGNSALSIFTIIDGMFSVDNLKLREWVRGCNMSQLIFNAWCDGFIGRIESDTRRGKLNIYIRTYLRELWSLVIHYQELIDQFYQVTENSVVSQETADKYSRFALEYNAFVQRFREYIGELRGVDKTEIEPPSVKLARELPLKIDSPTEPEVERRLPQPDEHKGYIM